MEKRIKLDPILVLCVTLVALAGIFTLYTEEAIVEAGSGRWYKQIIFFVLGMALAVTLSRLNYQVIGNATLPFYGISIVLLLITMIPFIGSEIKGARSWIRIGPVGIQTSEIAKLATIILLAKFLELRERDVERIPTLVVASLIALLPMVLIVIQPDFGGSFSFAPILFTMLYVAGADVLHMTSILIFFGVTITIPLYIEYHNIALVEPLIARLSDLGQSDLIPAVRILKYDVWRFIEKSRLPTGIDGGDKDYLANLLANANLMTSLREAGQAVRNESGGLMLRFLENDTLLVVLGSLLVITATVLFAIRFTQGRSMMHLRRFYIPLGVLGISVLAAVSVHLTFSFKYHQVARVTAFINPDKFPRDLAYQIRASKAAIGSGQLTGRGFSQGDMTMGERPLVPEADTDFIFTAWSERTGFIGSVLVILLLIAIPLRGLQISFESRDRFGSLLAAGVSAMFFFHIFFNAGITLGLLPVTGLPLSFMSYGGSHLIICLAGVGILLSVNRRRFAN